MSADYVEMDSDLLLNSKAQIIFKINDTISPKATFVTAKYGDTKFTDSGVLYYPWPKDAKTITLKPREGVFTSFDPAEYDTNIYAKFLTTLNVDKTKPIKYQLLINDENIGSAEILDTSVSTVIMFIANTDKTIFDAFTKIKATDTFSFVLGFTLKDGSKIKFTSPTIKLQ